MQELGIDQALARRRIGRRLDQVSYLHRLGCSQPSGESLKVAPVGQADPARWVRGESAGVPPAASDERAGGESRGAHGARPGA